MPDTVWTSVGLGLGILGGALAAAAAAYTAAVYLTYWAVRRGWSGGMEQHPSARPWRALVLEWGSCFLALLFGLPSQLLTRVRLRRGGAGTPVLCVHGYTQNWGNFVTLAPRLETAGCGPVYAINVRRKFASLEVGAAQVAEALRWVQQETGASQVDVVCHSMGGLLLRMAMADHGVAPLVRRAVTLGTPHHGTVSARFGPGINARQMRRDSPLFQKLPPPPTCFTSVWSTTDGIVLPPESSRIGGPQVVFDDLGHLSLLWSPRVHAAVVLALTAPSAPSHAHA
jgi:triacylglycerol lipase